MNIIYKQKAFQNLKSQLKLWIVYTHCRIIIKLRNIILPTMKWNTDKPIDFDEISTKSYVNIKFTHDEKRFFFHK